MSLAETRFKNMSALTQGMKFKLGGLFKQLFQRAEKDQPAPVSAPPLAAPAAPPIAKSAPIKPVAKPVSVAAPVTGKPAGPGVEIPFPAILAALPVELKSKVRQEAVEGLNFSAPLDQILPQLSSGAIRIPFGDIRRAAPTVFADDEASDVVTVSLPLNEILSRLNPALLTRRPAQKQLVVPAEISSPFADRGNGSNLAVGNNSPRAAVAPQAAAPAPVTPVQAASPSPTTVTPVVSALTAPLPGGTDLFQRKQAAVANGAAKPPIFPRKAGTPNPSSNGTEMFQRKPAAPATPATPVAQAPAAEASPAPGLARQSVTPEANVPVHGAAPLPATPPRPKDILSAPPVARSIQPAKPAVAPAVESPVIVVPLTAVAETWPEGVRQEVVQLRLVDARLAIPVALVEECLKRGRVAFPWKLVRSWIRPGTVPPASPHDSQELELPLAVIAPLFVAHRKSGGHQPRVTVSEEIPNLFFGLPKPEAPAAAKPADTNYFSRADALDAPRPTETELKRKAAAGAPSGTDLLVKSATPADIVARAAALTGVAGVLIALPDGLMVASRVPAEHNADTLAAFLPHIFTKVSQCTKELRMGELNNLNFTVGNIPWKIFRVNAIFFAAFGKMGEGLPSAELAALAAELDRKRT